MLQINRLQHNVNITFIYTGKQKKKCVTYFIVIFFGCSGLEQNSNICEMSLYSYMFRNIETANTTYIFTMCA